VSHAALAIPGLDRLGGAEQQLLLLAHGLRRRGWRVSVIALSGAGGKAADALAAAGIHFASLHMHKGVADPRGWVRFHRWLAREKPDVLHAHLPHATWLTRWSRLALPRLTIVDTLHSSSTGGFGRHIGYRLSDWLAGTVTAVSEPVAEAHRTAGLVSPKKLIVVPNGIDTAILKPDRSVRDAMRRELGFREEFLWIASGRLEPVKDYGTLLQAMRQLPAHARLLIAGGGSLAEELLGLASRLGLESRVRFLGFVPEMPLYLQAADAAVLSSLWEGLPMSLLEAGACALPAVATDVPGSREAVEHGVTGLLAPAGDPGALAAAMRTLMQSSADERRKMGERSRQRIVERYSMEAVLDRWESIYAECRAANCRHSERCAEGLATPQTLAP
jgi:glycosyltransferase involved in cell wall biosynthesis